MKKILLGLGVLWGLSMSEGFSMMEGEEEISSDIVKVWLKSEPFEKNSGFSFDSIHLVDGAGKDSLYVKKKLEIQNPEEKGVLFLENFLFYDCSSKKYGESCEWLKNKSNILIDGPISYETDILEKKHTDYKAKYERHKHVIEKNLPGVMKCPNISLGLTSASRSWDYSLIGEQNYSRVTHFIAYENIDQKVWDLLNKAENTQWMMMKDWTPNREYLKQFIENLKNCSHLKNLVFDSSKLNPEKINYPQEVFYQHLITVENLENVYIGNQKEGYLSFFDVTYLGIRAPWSSEMPVVQSGFNKLKSLKTLELNSMLLTEELKMEISKVPFLETLMIYDARNFKVRDQSGRIDVKSELVKLEVLKWLKDLFTVCPKLNVVRLAGYVFPLDKFPPYLTIDFIFEKMTRRNYKKLSYKQRKKNRFNSTMKNLKIAFLHVQ